MASATSSSASPLPGQGGTRDLGHRQLGWAWYDATRNQLLRDQGCVIGDTVRHSLNAPDIPVGTWGELAAEARERWAAPWLDAILHAIDQRTITGTPIAEYVPEHVVKGRLALVGDAAHVPTPMTGQGFNAALQDAAALAECCADGVRGTAAIQALHAYKQRRLRSVRQMVQSGQRFSRSFGRLVT